MTACTCANILQILKNPVTYISGILSGRYLPCFFLLEDYYKDFEGHLRRRKDPGGRYLSTCVADGT